MVKKEKMKRIVIMGTLFCCTNFITLNAQLPGTARDSITYNDGVKDRKIIFIRQGCFPCGSERAGEYEKARGAFDLSGTASFSAGYILNPLTEGRGINLAGHYHLNGYDELRFGGYAKREFINRISGGVADLDRGVKLETYLLSFDFAKGLKLKSSTNIYVGGGVTGGYERANGGVAELETGERLLQAGYAGIVGFRLFAEFEIALARKFSLSGRVGQQFLFSGSGVARYELIVSLRVYL